MIIFTHWIRCWQARIMAQCTTGSNGAQLAGLKCQADWFELFERRNKSRMPSNAKWSLKNCALPQVLGRQFKMICPLYVARLWFLIISAFAFNCSLRSICRSCFFFFTQYRLHVTKIERETSWWAQPRPPYELHAILIEIRSLGLSERRWCISRNT